VEKLDFAARQVSPGKFTQPGEDIPDGWEGVDIGPQARQTYAKEIASASTIPMAAGILDAGCYFALTHSCGTTPEAATAIILCYRAIGPGITLAAGAASFLLVPARRFNRYNPHHLPLPNHKSPITRHTPRQHDDT
jgi:hypothetical protein